MHGRKVVDVAEFSQSEEGKLVLWRYEDEGPAAETGRSVLGDDLRTFRVTHGLGPSDCGGGFRFRNISGATHALLCDTCGLRIVIPRAVGTLYRLVRWADSRRWNVHIHISEREWNEYHHRLLNEERARRAAAQPAKP